MSAFYGNKCLKKAKSAHFAYCFIGRIEKIFALVRHGQSGKKIYTHCYRASLRAFLRL